MHKNEVCVARSACIYEHECRFQTYFWTSKALYHRVTDEMIKKKHHDQIMSESHYPCDPVLHYSRPEENAQIAYARLHIVF